MADKRLELTDLIHEGVGELCATCVNEGCDCSETCDNYEQYKPNEWWSEVLERVEKLEAKAKAWDEAQDVMKKQEPIKLDLIPFNNEFLLSAVCPVCKVHLENAYNAKYCGDCGQRIDWYRSQKGE